MGKGGKGGKFKKVEQNQNRKGLSGNDSLACLRRIPTENLLIYRKIEIVQTQCEVLCPKGRKCD